MKLVQAVLVLALLAPASLYAQIDEFGVKAAFVRNFVAFVDWPPGRLDASGTLLICVFNDSPITPRLAALGEPIRGHRVQVRGVASLPDLGGCHAVFVPAGDRMHIADIRARYGGGGVLTIAEGTGERSGAVIDMFVSGSRMTFDVDLTAAEEQGVRVSSKLLALAHAVHGGAATGPARQP